LVWNNQKQAANIDLLNEVTMPRKEFVIHQVTTHQREEKSLDRNCYYLCVVRKRAIALNTLKTFNYIQYIDYMVLYVCAY
tara:strand:- start:32915 stop:33154 length:240 start_codon:yes stop_codon:yes gene_type:complete